MTSKIIFIVGPTGVGKSEAGFLLARKLGGEIISCDAMQVYRQVNIACDKPSLDMRREVPHHLIDVVSVTAEFDVARFMAMAVDAIADIHARGKIPIVVGGSGMYMSVLLDGIFQLKAKDEILRQNLEQQAAQEGPAILHRRLAGLDPKAAAKIHPNDTKRIVRALEVVILVGKPISDLQKERDGLWGKHPIQLFALTRKRDEMYRRVEARIDRMFAAGLIEEIRMLSTLNISRTAQALIGTPEVMGYIKGEYDLERAKYLMKLNTRHYVKRQLTWFRRDERLQWINIEEGQTAEDIILCMNG